MTERPRAILFDLDDTILDDTGASDQLWREVIAEAAGDAGDLDAALLYAAIDRVRTWYWSDPERHRVGRQSLRAATAAIVAQAFCELGLERDDVGRWIATTYRDRREAAIDVFPGAVDLLERVRAMDVRTALLTNGAAEPQRAKIRRFDLERHFDLVLVEGELGAGKPDPRVYRTALDAFDVEPAAAWMVGDNLEWDVAAPQRLGIRGIWIDRHGRGVPPGRDVRPHRIIRRLAELL